MRWGNRSYKAPKHAPPADTDTWEHHLPEWNQGARHSSKEERRTWGLHRICKQRTRGG